MYNICKWKVYQYSFQNYRESKGWFFLFAEELSFYLWLIDSRAFNMKIVCGGGVMDVA